MAEKSMQAGILAGGLGTRMLPITETIPKPMIAVAGKPLLQYQLELLSAAGIERALLLWLTSVSRFRNISETERNSDGDISYSFEPSPLGTGGRVEERADAAATRVRLGQWRYLSGD
jgi:NDP-sugar pyrophosphorylase family protein